MFDYIVVGCGSRGDVDRSAGGGGGHGVDVGGGSDIFGVGCVGG